RTSGSDAAFSDCEPAARAPNRSPQPALLMKTRLPILFLTLASALFAAQPYPPKFDGARAETYKEIGDVKLQLHIFEPAAGAKANRPAIVFFFGGGWTNGSPVQFEQHC